MSTTHFTTSSTTEQRSKKSQSRVSHTSSQLSGNSPTLTIASAHAPLDGIENAVLNIQATTSQTGRTGRCQVYIPAHLLQEPFPEVVVGQELSISLSPPPTAHINTKAIVKPYCATVEAPSTTVSCGQCSDYNCSLTTCSVDVKLVVDSSDVGWTTICSKLSKSKEKNKTKRLGRPPSMQGSKERSQEACMFERMKTSQG
jgi:hypothetical protein